MCEKDKGTLCKEHVDRIRQAIEDTALSDEVCRIVVGMIVNYTEPTPEELAEATKWAVENLPIEKDLPFVKKYFKPNGFFKLDQVNVEATVRNLKKNKKK